MRMTEIFKQHNPAFSFEFFPPRSRAASERLFRTVAELVPLEAHAVSVTYGAGGTTKERTHELVTRIREDTSFTVVPHLTCVGAGRDETARILDLYVDHGIENIMALRGDPPQNGQAGGETTTAEPATPGQKNPHEAFPYAADLVSFIRKRYPRMGIGVAGFPEGHPQTPNRLAEIEYLKAKVDAGADYICTQLFFDNRDFYDFRERCEIAGIRVPIVAGIMPITTRKGMARMADLAAGSRFPAWLLRALERAESDEYVENVGVHWATEQVLDLIDVGVDGVHFYTLNRSDATRRIYDNLGVSSAGRLSRASA